MNQQAVAIIGIGCRLPGKVNNVQSFWKLIENAESAITEVPADRWSKEAFLNKLTSSTGGLNTKRGGFVSNLKGFDASFFKFSPREASLIDPQQRWLLETTWEALEDAGIPYSNLSGSKTGVFIGTSSHDYANLQLYNRYEVDAYTNIGSANALTANRISYCFNFKGPSLAIDTACSSALMATHLACQSIWNAESEYAVAGGVNAMITPSLSIGFTKASMLSPDGECYAFDKRANGYVRSEGAAVALLCPLSTAIDNNYPIYATIKRSLANQDGKTSSLPVPAFEAQYEMLSKAYNGLELDQICYIEAHGTGTPIGDPIEAKAISETLAKKRLEPLPIGSVKTNFGHLEPASGIIGLIKTCLILSNNTIVPNRNFKTPNPEIDFKNNQLLVPTGSTKLCDSTQPKLAGVNSFGFGGSNVHVVLEQYVNSKKVSNSSNAQQSFKDDSVILPISANSHSALVEVAQHCLDSLEEHSSYNLAYNYAMTKEQLPIRKAFVTNGDLKEQLQQFIQKKDQLRASRTTKPRIAFVFSGQGSQWLHMATDLLNSNPVFCSAFNSCQQEFKKYNLNHLIEKLSDPESITQTKYVQALIFSIQVSLVETLKTWGINATAVVGHSLGELAAAYTAGIYNLKTAAEIVYHRSRLQQTTHGTGAMAVIGLSEAATQELIDDSKLNLEIAASNSPNLTSVSGTVEAVETLRLKAKNSFFKDLGVNYAFHSYQMDPIKEDLTNSLSNITASTAESEFYSSVSGAKIDYQFMNANYWWENVRKPVKFYEAFTQLALDHQPDLIIEIGTHSQLHSTIAECLHAIDYDTTVAATLRRNQDAKTCLLESLKTTYQAGVRLNWKNIFSRPADRIKLKHYPWQRKHYWKESSISKSMNFPVIEGSLIGESKKILNTPAWEKVLDLESFPFLKEHCIQGSCVLPASAYLELAIQVLTTQSGINYYIDGVEFLDFLYLVSEAPKKLRIILEENNQTLRVFTENGSNEWKLCFKSTLRQATASKPEQIAITELTQLQLNPSELYQEFQEAGYGFGSSFQCIKKAYKYKNSVLVEVHSDQNHDLDDFFLHPALLDACFQSTKAAQLILQPEVPNECYIPVKLDSLRTWSKLPEKFYVIPELIQRDLKSFSANLIAYTLEGTPILEVKGFKCQHIDLNPQQLHQMTPLYSFDWQYQALKETEASSKHKHRRVVIISDNLGLGPLLQEQLEDLEINTVIHHESSFDIKKLDQNFSDLIYLKSLDNPLAQFTSIEMFEAIYQRNCTEILGIVQNLAALDEPPNLWLVTKDLFTTNNATPECFGSLLWGFGRAVITESSDLKVPTHLLNIDSKDLYSQAKNILNELLQENLKEREISYHGSKRFVGRLLRKQYNQFDKSTSVSDSYQLTTDNPGLINNLRLKSVIPKALDPNKIRIEVKSAALNFRDVLKALGLYPDRSASSNYFGDECSGTVVEIGSQVKGPHIKVGQEVIALTRSSLATYVDCSPEQVIKIPAGLSFENTAGLTIPYLTAAYCLLDKANIKSGQSVLIHSAAGGVGLAAVHIALNFNTEVYATAGSEEKRSYLRKLGVKHVANSRDLSFYDQFLAETNNLGIDVILNSLTGDFLDKSLSLLADNGHFLEIGKRDVYQGTKLNLFNLKNNQTLSVIDLDLVTKNNPGTTGNQLSDIFKMIKKKQLPILPTKTFSIAEVQKAFEYMAKGEHIGRIVVNFDQGKIILAKEDQELQLDPEANYLVIGGSRGFGYALVKRLFERGAKHITVFSRDPKLDQFGSLLEAGCEVKIESGDVSNRSDVRKLVQKLKDHKYKLKGVFHCAMVIDDDFVPQLTAERFTKVLDPKVKGAWNLHKETENLELDYFVLFSSVAAILGPFGQSNYVAANSFLDALAEYRASIDLPALSVNWGVISDVGYVSEYKTASKTLEITGMGTLSSNEALNYLEQILNLELANIAVAEIDWLKLYKFNKTTETNPKYTHFTNEVINSSNTHIASSELFKQIQQLADQQAIEKLNSYVKDRLSKVLGNDFTQLDEDVPLVDLGLDSLMAFQLKMKVDKDFDINLSPGSFHTASKVSDIAPIILSSIRLQSGAQESMEQAA